MTSLDPTPGSAPTPAPPSPQAAPPAGWYADARNERFERWWDGTAWSDATRERTAYSTFVPPAPTGTRRAPAHNGPAYWSLALGLLSTVVGIVAVSGAHNIWISTSGLFAVLTGVRALRLRRSGAATALVPAVLGLVFGGLGILLLLATLLLNLTFTSWVSDDDQQPYQRSGQQSGQQSDQQGAQQSGATGTGADAAQTAVQPPSVLPDKALDGYRALPVRSVTSMKAGCGVVRGEAQPLPISTQAVSEARRMQDYLNLQVQVIVERMQPASGSKQSWPTAIDVDPDTHTVFLPAPACTALGELPATAVVRYGQSPDHAQIALAVFRKTDEVGALWRSVDDTVYTL